MLSFCLDEFAHGGRAIERENDTGTILNRPRPRLCAEQHHFGQGMRRLVDFCSLRLRSSVRPRYIILRTKSLLKWTTLFLGYVGYVVTPAR